MVENVVTCFLGGDGVQIVVCGKSSQIYTAVHILVSSGMALVFGEVCEMSEALHPTHETIVKWVLD